MIPLLIAEADASNHLVLSFYEYNEIGIFLAFELATVWVLLRMKRHPWIQNLDLTIFRLVPSR